MAIRKAPELHDWLLGLNFRIFTWQLDIGLWIETAIDWAVSWINDVWIRAENAYSWARAAWDHAGELFNIMSDNLSRLREELLGRFSSLGGYLGDWWLARQDEIRQIVTVSLSTIMVQIASLSTIMGQFRTEWDSFTHSTLPSLVNFSWFRSWWGLGDIPHNVWWSAARRQLREETAAELQPLEDQVRSSQGIISLAREFFADPEQWLIDRIESMLERFW